jgi:zinc/manganese transport system substrate-binding protein
MLGTILIFSKRTGTRLSIGLVSMAMLVSACGSDSAGSPGLTIVATTSIAGDLVSQVVGEDATVEVLMPIGSDPHDFQPSSQQAASLRSADLVVAWGLGLEEGMEDVLANAADDGVRVLELSALVDPIAYEDSHEEADTADEDHEDEDHEDEDHEDEEHEDEEHGHEGLDAHTWMDPVRMADAVRHIGGTLSEIAPDADWEARAEDVAGDLMDLHDEIDALLAAIPQERRKLVTNHDSFRYFAARYDFEIVGVAIPGGSTLASPSSAQIAGLIEAIRGAGVEVLFAETSSPAALLDAVADEVDGVRVIELLEGSLAAPGEPGDTYREMMVLNAETIAEALAP